MNGIWTTGRISLGTGWAVLVFGAWLVISPFALGFSHDLAGISNNIAVGLALILLTIGSSRNGLLRALMIALGAWVYVSGFLLHVSKPIFLWNNLILAILIIIFTIFSASPYPEDYPRRNQS